MASVALQIGIILVYLLVTLGIGVLAYRVTSRTAEDYYLADRSLGTIVLLFTTFATLLSAFTFLGGPNLAFAAGPEWILVMGLMNGVIFAGLWYAIGYKQWLVGRTHGYVTLGEMLGDRFGSRLLRGTVAVISLFWLLPYVMLQQMGAGEAMVGLTDGAIPYWAGAALITGFMILYVALAGLRGVAWTDTLQGIFMLGISWVAVGWVLAAVGGLGAATGAVGAEKPEFLALGGGLYTPGWVLSTAITIAAGAAMFPQINQRFFVARDDAVLKRSFVLWPALVLLLFVPAFLLGTWAAGLGIAPPEGGNVLPALLVEYTPGWFAAAVVAGAMAAMMSSSDSMLLSGASYVTRDLYRPIVADVSSNREAWLGRAAVVAIATLAFAASLFRPGSLIEVGDTAFGGFAQLAMPVLVALYWQGTNRWGMYAGVYGSQAFYVAHVFTPLPAGYVLPGTGLALTPGIWGMALGLVITVGVSLATSPAATEEAARFELAAD